MSIRKSHVDLEKLDKVPDGHPFEYNDIVEDNFSIEERTVDGKRFKAEVGKGIHEGVVVDKDTGAHLLYRKLK